MRNVLLLLPALAFALRRPQTVVCRDARTQREVTLVGCMHYNPASIALAADCVREAPALGAVVVESCESRWRKTQQTSPAHTGRPWLCKYRNGKPCEMAHSLLAKCALTSYTVMELL